MLRQVVNYTVALCSLLLPLAALATPTPADHVAVLRVDSMILPGTMMYLREGIEEAAQAGAKAVVVELDTPGGLLQSAQEIIQDISAAPIPVFVYVTPTGGAAISAGVLVVQASHVAAMAPGTSIGAAHPVTQEGEDIKGDMRTKVENATVAIVTSIAATRGRNTTWAADSVRKSSSLTDAEAQKERVVDFVAQDIPELLRKAAGKEVSVAGNKTTLPDLSKLPIKPVEFGIRYQVVNTISHPNVIAILWLLATTGISIELYNPGLIFPGVVGGLSLIIALAMSQVIPINQGAILLLVAGAALIGAEIFTGSLILGISGLIAICLGALYIIDTTQAPGMEVALSAILPTALVCGGILLAAALAVYRALRVKTASGKEALVGERGKALENFSTAGKVSIHGEIWKAKPSQGIIMKDQAVVVTRVLEGLLVEVAPDSKASTETDENR